MSRFKTFLLIAFLLGETACGSLKRYKDYEYNVRDSVIVRTQLLWRDTVVYDHIRDSVTILVTRDTTSHLETDVAISDVSVSGGVLSHILTNKVQLRPIEIRIPEWTVTTDKVRVVTQKEIVEVEKKATFKDNLYPALVGFLVALTLVWTIFVFFGKK